MQHLFHSITHPVVCATCAEETAQGLADAASLQNYSRLDVGFTDRGLQVWRRRHQANLVHIDFEGRAPDADFRRLEKKPGR
ncbi:MAG: hypothetical protein RIB45_04255 [Marivibrio sp.]|uniref:hypothetical protein n=1 Tax=Marivibrio sp. TaxID=2039719 RepID=UPI0032EBAEE4